MSEDQNKNMAVEVDAAFLKSKRGILKAAELVSLLVGFVCFTAASGQKYMAATGLEFLITLLLVLLYLLKLNKRLTFFFWPLIDLLNSVFAAVYFVVLSAVALAAYTVTGTLVGAIVGFMSAGLLCADSYILFKNITFNKSRSEAQTQTTE